MQHTGDKPIFSQFYRIEYVIYSIAIYKRETKTVVLFFRMASPTECEGGNGWARCLQTAATPATRSPAGRPERYCCRPTLTTELELRLQDAWDSYMDEALTTSKFPRTVAHLYGPKDDGM